MTDIQLFDFKGYSVRVILINDEPWVVAADVSNVLGLKNLSSSIASLDDDEKGLHSMETLRGEQPMAIISESGLYTMIMKSRKPEAREFQRWVTREVLPAIRKTGHYSTQDVPQKTQIQILAEVTAVMAQTEQDLIDQGKRIDVLGRLMIDHQDAINRQQEQARDMKSRMDSIEQNNGWVSALGYANKNGLTMTSNADLSRLGRRASKILREHGIEPRDTTNQAFGTVHIYPEWALEQAVDELEFT